MIRIGRFTHKKYDFMKKGLIFSLITVFILIAAFPSNAYERPAFKDGLVDKWHPGGYCIPCHYTLLNVEDAQKISNGCKCHEYRPKNVESGYKVDMTQILDIHKDTVCIRCHVGTKSQANLTAGDFHLVMSKTPCLSCHTYVNGTYLKPEKTRCSECHSGDPHVVHGDRLEKMCEACHGDFAEKYVNNTGPISFAPSVIKEPTVEERFTVGEFIAKILQSLLRIGG
ncbi:MAG TPA: hypothetical protein VIO58_02045 [Candidatus Methanoperedens sp.]